MFGRKKKPASFGLTEILRCSFCRKSQHDVKIMIAAPQVQICDECVDICLEVIAEKRKDREPHGTDDPKPGTVVLCGLCRMATTLDDSLAIRDRGVLCAGCLGEIQAALAELEQPA